MSHRRPLLGKRVLVLRPRHQAEETARALSERGAIAIVLPLIEVVPPPDPEPLSRALWDVESYELVAFTSVNAVHAVVHALRSQGRDADVLNRVRMASIGPGTTAALREWGLEPAVIAKEHVGEGMGEAILASLSPLPPKPAPRVLLPRALVAREELPSMLREAGIDLDVVAAYETRPISKEQGEALAAELSRGAIDAVLLTSSSTVKSLRDALGDDAPRLLSKVTLATIGPIARETAENLGLRVDVSADPYTVPALLDALERHFGK